MKTLSRALLLLCVLVILAVGAAHLVGASSTGEANQPITMPMPTPAPHPSPSVQP